MKKITSSDMEKIQGGKPRDCWRTALYLANPITFAYAETIALACLVASL
ncbi:hypothetical protein M2T92_16305 [Elizabethkingia miricola]|nr:hypothetical protein [Elizabethkingia miricola]MCL1680602.1 hypothetical protein [Elizabethkingia miricola]